MRSNNIKAKLVAFAVTASIAVTVQAQTRVLEEIVVTATKRTLSIQDVPFSINAQTQDDIQRAGATTLEEISRNVSGLSIQNLGPGQSQVAIRGVSAGQIVRDQPGVKEQVGIYVDESVISLSLFTPDLDFYDLNRVETLRGPQGTLFGSGSIGGTIRYITNQPDLEESSGAFELNLNSVSDGEVGGHAKGYINAPFADGKAAFRGVVYHTEYGGFIDAVGPAGGDDVNSGTRTGGRFAVTYQPNDRLTLTPRLIVQNIETDGNNREDVFNFLGSAVGVDLGEREQFLLTREAFEDDIVIADLTAVYSFDGFDATSITSFTDRDILVSRDASALTHSVSEDFGLDPAVNAIPSNLLDETELSQFTYEFRLSSNGDGPFNWVAGAFYSDTDRDYTQRLPTPGFDAFFDVSSFAIDTVGANSAQLANGFPLDSPFNSDIPFELEQISIFGEFSYDINERTQLTVGGRFYDYEETRTISQGGIFGSGADNVVDETESDGFNPRVLLSYDLNDNVTYNAQVSEGFRLGGVNDPLNVNLCSEQDAAIFGDFQDFDDESLVNYEVGFKASYNRVSINAAAYYTDISDLQVTLDAGTCSSRVSFNVPDAHTAGLELELKAKPSDYWDFSVVASLLEAEFDSTILDGSGNIVGGVEDGNRLASVPEFSASASAAYTIPSQLFGSDGDLSFSTSIQFVGDRITQPADQVAGAGVFEPGLVFGQLNGSEVVDIDLELPSYEIVNANVAFDTEAWSLSLYINNLFDENALLSFDRERGGRARTAFRINTPRTVGVTYRHNF